MSRIPIRVLVTAVAMLVFAIAPTATAAPSATTAAQQQAAVTADPFYSCTRQPATVVVRPR